MHRPESDEELQAFTEKLKELYNELFVVGGRDLAGRAILHLSQEANMTIADLQSLKGTHPSPKWETVAPSLSLEADLDLDQLDRLVVPTAFLPPSFHRELMKKASLWLDVYQEPWSQVREEARVRLLEAWYVPICALFAGRLIDKPETPMPATPETSGGQVKHKVFLFDNLILLVVEMKHSFTATRDYYAQVLLELLSAMKLNRDRDLDPQPPIYAMLSDLRDFYFLSYDGTQFRVISEFSTLQKPRTQFMTGMVHVADLMFSILLNGYIEMLEAVEKRSRKREVAGDISQHHSFAPGKPNIKPAHKQIPRVSLDQWSKALLKAREAQNILVNLNFMSESTWEEGGQRGLAALKQSVKFLRKVGSRADWDEGDSTREIGGVMAQVIKAHQSRGAAPGCVAA